MAQPPVIEPLNRSKDPPQQTVILQSTPSITSFQRQDRTVKSPQNSPFQLLESMPVEAAHKSWPMFIPGFFTPFVVFFLSFSVMQYIQDLFGKNTDDAIIDASYFVLPLLYTGTVIYSFTRGNRSFGKGLAAAAAATALFFFIYSRYGRLE